MRKEVTAIFDIGKTNKKFLLFDSDFKPVFKEYKSFETVLDDDSVPCEDLESMLFWMKKVFAKALDNLEFEIIALNFSSYGASLIHLDESRNPVTPLYDYAKELPQTIKDSFLEKYGPIENLCLSTGVSDISMLNSGLQLFWLKYEKPEIFKQIKYSMHLPQYLSYVFSKNTVSEYTSIGCHTGLWNYKEGRYHPWVYEEGIDKLFPPIVSSSDHFTVQIKDRNIKVGVGIHDSSASLLPYTLKTTSPYLLVSTGTWSVTLNPSVKKQDLPVVFQKNTLYYMGVDGSPVLANRFYLGNEFAIQLQHLNKLYNKKADYFKSLDYSAECFQRLSKNFSYCFKWESMRSLKMLKKTTLPYSTFEEAYHQLLFELTLIQVDNIRAISDRDSLRKIFVEGGFADNKVFIGILRSLLDSSLIHVATSAFGSALGAAIVISETENYSSND